MRKVGTSLSESTEATLVIFRPENSGFDGPERPEGPVVIARA